MTYAWGFYFYEGKRVGYDITFSNKNGTFVLYNVSSKDKNRVIKEIMADGYKREEITVERREH
jgi:hypothetical protein